MRIDGTLVRIYDATTIRKNLYLRYSVYVEPHTRTYLITREYDDVSGFATRDERYSVGDERHKNEYAVRRTARCTRRVYNRGKALRLYNTLPTALPHRTYADYRRVLPNVRSHLLYDQLEIVH